MRGQELTSAVGVLCSMEAENLLHANRSPLDMGLMILNKGRASSVQKSTSNNGTRPEDGA